MTINKDNIMQSIKDCDVYADTPLYDSPGRRQLTCMVSFALSDGKILEINKGFQWDEATVPWIAQWAFPKSGKYAFSALPHDALYYINYKDRKFVDMEFKRWMKVTELSKFQITFRYCAVRLFGGSYWNRNVKHPSYRCIRNRRLINVL